MIWWFSSIMGGSYALGLLLYALVFKIVFLPFSIKQQKNQIKMAKLTPKIELIKAKYRGRTDNVSRQKLQQEIMELQQKEGYSPLSGCLPLLIQLPIILLLYTVIQGPLSYIAKPTDSFKDYNDNYASATLTDYEGRLDLGQYGITEENKVEINRTDVSLQLYLDFSSDTEEAKQTVLDNFAKTKADKGANKAYKDLKKTLKIKEISLVGRIRDFVDNGVSEGELASLTTVEQREAYISSYGIEYSSIPNFMLWGVNLADTPSLKNISILCLIPILAAAAQWVSMWLMRKFNGNPNGPAAEADKQAQASMKMMDLMMPAMTLFLAFSLSGMLGIYWIYQSLLGLLTSFIMAKAMPIPKFTEDEIKEIRRQQKEAEKAQRAAAKSGPKYRSLHYIDDEDYEELPPVPNDSKSTKSISSSDIPEIKD